MEEESISYVAHPYLQMSFPQSSVPGPVSSLSLCTLSPGGQGHPQRSVPYAWPPNLYL